ncbi:MAG: MMPL family transporter [Lachnospiraceae bacterium]|nr:MMPL family transporter [Lachnospiraceae bacterium]
MKNFGKAIVKCRIPIVILSLLLLIPSVFGYLKTKVNYDILYYLPDEIETMVGQDILVDQFGTGAFSFLIVEGMEAQDVAKLKEDVKQVDGVSDVLWYDSFADLSIPMTMLPDKLYDAFNNGDCTMMAVLFSDTTSADGTMKAIEEIRKIAGKQCFLSGMSAVVVDTKNLSDQETPIYVLIAVVLATIVLGLTMDSYLAPVFFLIGIGFSIIYNLGSNIVLGEISYITQALTAVLQLGVTMDYSIFLWHSYEENLAKSNGSREDAMADAIADTITSVVGSSITTVAGFVALCFMSFKLGMDLGIVMAKGVLIGVISCVTILPSMLLLFDKVIQRTHHKPLLPDLPKVSEFIVNHAWIFAILFVVLLIPAFFGYKHTSVYYNLDSTLPKDLPSIVANEKLDENFEMNCTHMLLTDASLPSDQMTQMIADLKSVDGVKEILGLDSIVGPGVPSVMIPDDIRSMLESDEYRMMLIVSEYKVASDEVNMQCDRIGEIAKSYDPKSMLVGEAPCTRDLIRITDHDFATVSEVSIGAIFFIILFVFKSVSLPLILVGVIELAIFINMGVPYYTGTVIPFVASIVIGTIQLGSTVDYAILMTTRYKQERSDGKDKKEAMLIAHEASMKSIIVSALSFFAATFGVGLVSNIDMIGSLCTLMARGALISMCIVLTMLPTMLLLFDKLICFTSWKFAKDEKHAKGEEKPAKRGDREDIRRMKNA